MWTIHMLILYLAAQYSKQTKVIVSFVWIEPDSLLPSYHNVLRSVSAIVLPKYEQP